MNLGDAPHMAEMGLMTSVVAPGLVLLLRKRTSWGPLSWPAYFALPFFVMLHLAITLGMHAAEPPPLLHLLLHGVLLVGAVIFWLPVLAGRWQCDAAGRVVYLFLGAPALDLAGVIIVATGDSIGGLTMIVTMLPIGLVAVALAWRWIIEDERSVRANFAEPDSYVAPPAG